jgi:BirA family biotin operon repressor/biotin-[acetyl-CoA-carboxylase] ligase
VVAGLAAAAAIEDVAAARATVKWPNDVRIEGRKVCGVLVEARSEGRRLFPVAGIGINVHHRAEDFPAESRDVAASLASVTSSRPRRGVLLATLLARLEEILDAERAGALDLPAAFARRDETLGREVVVEADGVSCRGVGAGVADDGALLLDVPGRGTVSLRAGDASVRQVA